MQIIYNPEEEISLEELKNKIILSVSEIDNFKSKHNPTHINIITWEKDFIYKNIEFTLKLYRMIIISIDNLGNINIEHVKKKNNHAHFEFGKKDYSFYYLHNFVDKFFDYSDFNPFMITYFEFNDTLKNDYFEELTKKVIAGIDKILIKIPKAINEEKEKINNIENEFNQFYEKTL